MFAIDDKFVDELGLSSLSQEDKEEFAEHIKGELEQRVGDRLTEGMTDEMLDEFGSFVDGDEASMREWFNANDPQYLNTKEYQELKASLPDAPEAALMSQYGALKWLQINRPDYPEVVQSVLSDIKSEIISSRESIMQGIEEAEAEANANNAV